MVCTRSGRLSLHGRYVDVVLSLDVKLHLLQCFIRAADPSPSRVCLAGNFCLESVMLCTVGYTRAGNRQIAVWDKRQMKSWVNMKTVDLGTPGTPLLLYDRVRCADVAHVSMYC